MQQKVVSRYSRAVTASLCIALSGLAACETLPADWLYMSGTGSWLSRSQSINEKITSVPLPLDNVSADNFWWQTEKPNSQLVWRANSQNSLPALGSEVLIQGAPETWQVVDASADMLVLKRGSRLRYWPRDQWYQLEWVEAEADSSFSFQLIQQNKQANKLQYAWWDAKVSAEVQYRLNLDKRQPSLTQELLVRNDSPFDLTASGYSFSQVAQRQPILMRTTTALAENDSAISVPVESQSQGLPLLVSDKEVYLPANSRQWLPVSTTPLQSVARHYQINWDSSQSGTLSSQYSLKLAAKQSLPAISGDVKVPLFDHKLAMLTSYYQPSSDTQAELSLGESQLVSLNAEARGKGRWLLETVNRTDEMAEISLTLSHWDGKTRRKVPLKLRLPAGDTKQYNVTVNSLGQLQVN
ncbi:hypothetical protein [Reinekea thalattae]|uniref:Uncharacterized protein n=1 Tax=Reinekea thalattae TaxID=2593301 RepID=A0A5C8ZC05_9GAMM|nr:hypothetical protein [Reinekea thalattae]TXR54819.1 hypothetical protein FME95_09880 [Reinekea thalattae]